MSDIDRQFTMSTTPKEQDEVKTSLCKKGEV